MKSVRGFLAVALVAFAIVLPVGPISPAGAIQEAPVPEMSARAVFSIDVASGVQLYAKNPDEPRQPASTTKIATAIVVLNHVDDLTEPVQIAAEDVADISFESYMGVQAGDTLTVEQLLYGMLIPSGNDAARALARHVGGKLGGDDPIATFVGQMNELAASLGLQNTHFTNPVGLDNDPDHYTTARDLATLTVEALTSKVIATIVRTEEYSVTTIGPEQRVLPMSNYLALNGLLGWNGVHGVKTGSTQAAGGCIVVASWANGRNRVITVILGSTLAYNSETGQPEVDNRWEDMRTLLTQMDRDYRWIAAAEPDEVPGLHEEMAAWQVQLREPAAIVAPASNVADVRYRLQLGPPGAPDSQVGRVLFFIGQEQIAERPVFQVALAQTSGAATAVAVRGH